MTPTDLPTALVFHAERLHDDRVWRRTRALAALCRRRGSRATFLVYPFPAQVAGREIAERVQELSRQGHEIGQHTHFYRGSAIEGCGKLTDLSATNIGHCLRRDRETLQSMGFRPRGFAAGAWAINDTILHTLAALDFRYDCSARLPRRMALGSDRDRLWLIRPECRTVGGTPLWLLPTTATLAECFRIQRDRQTFTCPYRLVYLHDYDLLRWPVWSAALGYCLLRRQRVPVAQLMDMVAQRCQEPWNK